MNDARAKKIVLFLLLIAVAFGGNIIAEFSVSPKESSIEIRFVSSDESAVSEFAIERSIGSDGAFQQVVVLQPKGNGSTYLYHDQWNWMNKVMVSAVYYRIRIKLKDGSVQYSEPAVALPKINEIIKSWGSIKLLFR